MAPSKRQRRFRRPTDAWIAVLAALLLVLALPGASRADSEPAPLQLEIKINGFPLNAIGAFALMPNGDIASPRSELEEMGIAVPGEGPSDELISLNSIPGLSHVYDEENQIIELEVADGSRIAKSLDAKGDREFVAAESGSGLVLNYTAFASAGYMFDESELSADGGSLTLDARAFSPYGTLQQTAIVGTTAFDDMTFLRLDTSWSYSDQKRMLTYRLGDIISGGLGWTRPVRLGGGQIRRNFDLRPDLVTMPLPLIEGSTAVPSTLDVYIDGIRSYSGQIQEGPYKIDSIPVYTNSGTARVVVTDSTGREIETESEFFTSPDLLKRDLYDFSIDAGVVRRSFGAESYDYDNEPVALASLRYGITDIVTGEFHAEASADLAEAGVGFLLNAGRAGMFSAAVAGSFHENDTGLFIHGGWEWRWGDLGLTVTGNRTFGDFNDLAAVTSDPLNGSVSADVPRALDQVSLTYSFPELQSGVGLSFIHRERDGFPRELILSGSYSQSFDNGMALFVSAFTSFGEEEDHGVFAGLSIPLGETMSATGGGSLSKTGWTAGAEVSRPYDEDSEMPVAWRVSHSEGDTRFTTANGRVRTAVAEVEGNLANGDDGLRGNLAVDGAFVFVDGSIMAGRRIDDAFAVVDAGAEGVSVQYENRPAGKTGSNGKLLLPRLNSYIKNKIAIDVEGLPLNADVGETETTVVPRERAGIVVKFGVNKSQQAALVILTDSKGEFLPESSEVFLEGEPEPFLVGYDGQVYLTGISPANSIIVKRDGKECRARFDYQGSEDTQTVIGPIPCV